MKKIYLSLVISILIILTIASVTFADTAALPGSGWWSGEQVQNVGESVANITLTAYDSSSDVTYPIVDTINPGYSKTYLPWDFTGMPAGFQGSGIISSNSDIRAIVNITTKYNSGQGVGDPSTPSPAAGQYVGLNSPGTTIYFPLVKNNHLGRTTSFAIQNGGGEATTATATFYVPSSSGGPITPYTYTTPSIGPGKMVIIHPSDAGAPSGDGIYGSGVINSNSSQPLAGTFLEYNTSEVHATLLLTARASTLGDSSNSLYAPIIKNDWYDRDTTLYVQNVSGETINVTVSYKGSPAAAACAGSTYTDSKTGLPDGESWRFLSNTVLPSDCLAAATITGPTGKNILAIVDEEYNTIPAGKYQEGQSYNVFSSDQATTIISVPLYKENSYGKYTGISVQNVSESTANVVAKFMGPTGTYITQPQSIPVGQNLVYLHVRNESASYWNGTAMTPTALGCAVPDDSTGCGTNGIFGVIITSDQPIVAIANETASSYFLQDKHNYEGLNLDSDPTVP